MALWKDSNPAPTPAPAAPPPAATPRETAAAREPERSNVTSLPADPAPTRKPEMKESVVAADITIEGKIEGSGHVRIAGKFKGDVNVDGNLTIDRGATVTGQVRAAAVIVSGELNGNIEGAKRVELQEGGVIAGDVKSGSLTVAAGSRMRGQVEFGWDGVKSSDTRSFGTAK